MRCKGCEERRKKFRAAYEKAKKALSGEKVKKTSPRPVGKKAGPAKAEKEK